VDALLNLRRSGSLPIGTNMNNITSGNPYARELTWKEIFPNYGKPAKFNNLGRRIFKKSAKKRGRK